MGMNRRRTAGIALAMSVVVAGYCLAASRLAAAESGEAEKRPERLIVMAAEYPGVSVPAGEDVSMDLIFNNKGRSDESMRAWVASEPADWKTKLKTYRYTVTGVYVPGGERRTITFEAEPPKDVKPGKYEFLVKSQSADGVFKLQQDIEVTVRQKEEGKKEAKGVKLTTSYPVLRGPSDVKFEFSVEVESKLDKDAVFDLLAQAPDGWDVNFKPAYESKYISSVRLKANQSQSVAVEVKPPPNAKAGEYPITVRVSSGDAKGEADLKVVLTGTYGIDAGTPSGLLSLDVQQGKAANLSIYVKNTGTAANHDVHFVSFKPENWKVEFKPDKIPVLDPDALQQVEVTITPYEEALVGDYSVGVNVEGEKASKSLEFRVTVKASATWAWIGIGIIVVVIAGLTGLFRALGRR
jgi:uncharacterized membrane protein